MDSSDLEARVASLERSLRRSRATAAAVGLGAVVVTAGAFAQQSASSLEAQMEEWLATRLQAVLVQQAQAQVATQRLALTDESNVELVLLRGDTDGSLLVLTPSGAEIVRLGGPAARHIGH